MGGKKVLVTFFCAVAIFSSLAIHHAMRLPEPIALETQGLPTAGNRSAPLKLVVFEDFRCCNCKAFHETLFPEIQASYIDSGKALYTLVPLAFMQGSKRLANAALAVYESAPERFFPFAHALFQRFSKEDADREELLQAAQEVGGIDISFLDRAIQKKLYYAKLEQILDWAKEVMQEDFGVPTLYANGIPVPTTSFRAIQTRIKRVEQ